MIELGVEAKDKITGFSGIITGFTRFLTGCDQYCLVSPAKDGKTGEAAWFDQGRVEVIGKGVTAAEVAGTKNGVPNQEFASAKSDRMPPRA